MYILFQNIWSNLKKEPLVSVLFILQIAITAYVIFVTCFEVKYESEQLASVNTTYGDYSFYHMDPNFEVASNDEITDFVFGTNKFHITERVDQIIEDMRALNGVKLAINQYGGALPVLDGLSYFDPEDKNNEDALVYWANETRSQWDHCRIDKAFFELFPVRLDSGRFFTDEEFELENEPGSTVPVLLGYEFKKYYEIGDVLETELNWNIVWSDISPKEDYVVNVEVIGFIAKDEVFPDDVGSTLISYNKRIVSPYNNRRYSEYTDLTLKEDGTYSSNNTFAQGVNGTYILVDKDRETEIVNEMKELLKKYDLDGTLKFRRYLYTTASIENNYMENMGIRIALTILTVVFAFVSVILLTVNRITANIRNYAIHLISGGTYNNIYLYVVGEVIVYSLFGYALGSGAYALRNLYHNYFHFMPRLSHFGFTVGWWIGLAMITLFSLASLSIVVSRMKKIDLSAAIRDKVYADGGKGTVYKIVTVSAYAVISMCIIFAVSYLVFLNNIDMYYRNFYTANTKFVAVRNNPNAPSNIKLTADFTSLGDNYVVDKLMNSYDPEFVPNIRATYYHGDVELPEMRSGRYFTEEEMNSKRGSKIAVVGQKVFEKFTYEKDDGKDYFTFGNVEFEVIGIMGREDGTDTKIDEWIFIPLNTAVNFSQYTGTYIIDGPSKADVQKAYDILMSQLEDRAIVESADREYSVIVIGPTDALLMLGVMIAINIVIVSIYYTDKKQYTISVKKFLGYSRTMIFIDLFTGFLYRAFIGFAIGVAIIFAVILSPLHDSLMFRALSLNLPTVIFSFGCTVLLTFIFALIAINRTYNRDTSEVLRG